MNRLELLKTLRRHVKLSERRSLTYEQNTTAKILTYIAGGFVVVYLIFIAVMLALIGNNSTSMTTCELLYALMPFALVADFFFRFMAQQTPSQLIKPYILLPIPKHACVETFILTAMLNPNNMIWMTLFVPYALMAVVFSEGIVATLGFLLGLAVLVIINSQWYMLVRTLINDRIWWWALPALVYAAVFSPWYLGSFTTFANFYGSMGNGAAHWNPLVFLGLAAALAGFFLLNRKIQFHYVYAELAAVTQTRLKNISQLRYLDRFGEVGEYLKLEVKSIMRNKNMRKQFIFAVAIVIVFSLLLSFTNIYDDNWNSNFLAFYNFAIFGMMGLSRIMCAEGNYIDGIMVHRENIISLLKAKYYFYTLMLFLPLLLMIPTVIKGKCSLLMLISIFTFTAGIEFFIMMQMAVYNRQTIPLNTKFISKGSMDTNYFSVIVNLAVLFVPVIIVSLLLRLFNPDGTYLILMFFGMVFMATNSLWIRNIYNRLMKRRYKNMESFRATR